MSAPGFWESQDPRSNAWIPYSGPDAQLLEAMWNRGGGTVNITLGATPFTCDTRAMTQTNAAGGSRKMRRTVQGQSIGGGGGGGGGAAVAARPHGLKAPTAEHPYWHNDQGFRKDPGGKAAGAIYQGRTALTLDDCRGFMLCIKHNRNECKYGTRCNLLHVESGATRPPTRIEVSAKAMVLFLESVMGPRDRCSVAAFNDGYHPIAQLAPKQECQAAEVVLTQLCDKTTAMWKAIAISVAHFVTTADGKRPWVLIIVTDGKDSASERGMRDKAKELLSKFNAHGTNFVFIIGMGSEIVGKTKTDLEDFSKQTGSLFMEAKDIGVLMLLFALIALQVTEGTRVDIAKVQREGGAEAVFARVSKQRQVSQRAIDILILQDVSGSMLCF